MPSDMTMREKITYIIAKDCAELIGIPGINLWAVENRHNFTSTADAVLDAIMKHEQLRT